MFDILARARRYQSLTPAERALLRLLEGLAFVALIGAATAATQYLASPPGAALSALSWPTIARVCAAGAGVAVLLALAKYFKAHGDPSLADTLATLTRRVATDAAIPEAPPIGSSAPTDPPGPNDAGALASR